MKMILEKRLSNYEREEYIVRSAEIGKLGAGDLRFRVGDKIETLRADRYGRLYVGYEIFQRLGLTRTGTIVIIEQQGSEYRLRARTEDYTAPG